MQHTSPRSSRTIPADRIIPWLTAVAWLAAVAVGLVVLMNYGSRPGNPGDPPTTWLRNVAWQIEPGQPELLVFAHPKCPCTDATLEQLQRVLARVDQPVRVDLVFWTPGQDDESATVSQDSDWAEGRLWDAAARLPQAKRHLDPDGVLTRRFGVKTSGHVLLYGTDGRLLFSGGITSGRGHEGDNPGADALLATLRSQPNAEPTVPASNAVFGCEIQPDDQAACTQGGQVCRD